MPSSTSNFDFAVPNGPWGRTLIFAVVLSSLFLTGFEVFYRHAGHRPSLVDDKKLWSLARERIYEGNPKTVVLVGDSRIQVDFSTDYFRQQFPDYALIQLAIDGRGNILATLEDLADDSRFTGIVLCSLNVTFLMISDGQQDYLDYYYNEWTLDKKLNREIVLFLQKNAVIFNPNVGLANLWDRLGRFNQLPVPLYVTTREDRSRLADYALTDIMQCRRARVQKVQQCIAAMKSQPQQKFEILIEKINRCVQKLEARGCRVVFVQFPSTMESWQFEEEFFPKRRYWDRFAASTHAQTIHFQDVPALRNFECPDTSHLDYRDAPRFTKGLLNELVSHGVLDRPEFVQADR